MIVLDLTKRGDDMYIGYLVAVIVGCFSAHTYGMDQTRKGLLPPWERAPMNEEFAKFFIDSMELYHKTSVENNFPSNLTHALKRINTIVLPMTEDGASFSKRTDKIF